MDKSHNTDLKALFTDLYDVPQSYRYTTKTQGDFILEKPFISICSVSTLPWLKKNLKPDDVSSGFFARFLIIKPPKQNDRIPPALPFYVENNNSNAKWMFKSTLENIEQEYKYKLSLSARKRFEELHQLIYEIPKRYNEQSQIILEPYLKRWSPYLLKLAMIMRIFEDPHSKEISDTAINSAMAFLLPVIKSTAFLFEGELGESDHQMKCREVFDWIKVAKEGRQIKHKEILTSNKLSGGSDEYKLILNTLIESGKLILHEQTKKMDWLYVPNKQ